MTLSEILAALLDATPAPDPGLAPENLLELFSRMHSRRAEILAQLGPSDGLTSGEAEMAAELEARDADWMRCLAAAKQATADQKISAGRVRAYAASLGG